MLVIQEKEKNILVVLSVIVVAACFLMVYKPTSDESKKLRQELRNVKAELSRPEVSREQLVAFRASIDAVRLEIDSLINQIPNSEDRGFLVRDLEELARKNKIELVSFMPKEAVPMTITGQEINKRSSKFNKKQKNLQEQHAKVLKTVINIDSKGKFEQYTNFFRDVIAYYRAVEISDIVMAKSTATKGIGADKRFTQGGGTRGSDPLEQARNTDLNVSFTLLAYTALDN